MLNPLFAPVLLVLVFQGLEPVTFGKVLGVERVITVVSEETTGFVSGFSEMTGVKPEVTNDFRGHVGMRIANVEIEMEETAPVEAALRVRFRLFLANMTAFLLATQQQLLFDTNAVTVYLNAAVRVGRCGEVPCESGCPEKPCDLKCNAWCVVK